MMSSPNDMSTHDVARLCGVAPRTVLRWVDAGVLPGYQTGGGRRRIRKGDLVTFMRGRGMAVPDELAPNRNRVAIVDDDRLHVQMMLRMLHAGYPGLEVETAVDGFAAGALVFSFKPHLIFLDLVMPGMDGFEVCRRIRADRAFDDVGIVIVTGHLTDAWRTRLAELGADECLVKPFKPQDLDHILQRFVPEGVNPPQAAAN